MQLKLHIQLQIMRGPPGIVTITSSALAVTVTASGGNSMTTVLPALLRFVVILARSIKMTARTRMLTNDTYP